MHVVENEEIMRKILLSNYPQYKDKLVFEVKRQHTVFSRVDSEHAPQVIVLS